MLKIQTFVFNPLSVNCYVVYASTGDAAIIDPSFYFEEEQKHFVSFIESNNLHVKHIIITHFHFDHLMGADFAVNKFKVPLTIHKDYIYVSGNFDIALQSKYFGFDVKSPPKPKIVVSDGDEIMLDGQPLKIIHVPGHSPCGIALYAKESKFVVSGDTLFDGGIGRTDLIGGNMEQLLSSIKSKIFILPDDTVVYPGHGNSTTIEQEKKYNAFLSEK
jgi:glyoxylase-like metal-dependent hydrolase (beta-lactamase superfamily II)